LARQYLVELCRSTKNDNSILEKRPNVVVFIICYECCHPLFIKSIHSVIDIGVIIVRFQKWWSRYWNLGGGWQCIKGIFLPMMWRWNEFYWCLNCWNKQRKPIVDGIVNHPLKGIMSFATKKTMILNIQCLYKRLYSYNITFHPTWKSK
jgi:hypothetical protein